MGRFLAALTGETFNDPHFWRGSGEHVYDLGEGFTERNLYFLAILFYSGLIEATGEEYRSLPISETLWRFCRQLRTSFSAHDLDLCFTLTELGQKVAHYYQVINPKPSDAWLVDFLATRDDVRSGEGRFVVPLVPMWDGESEIEYSCDETDTSSDRNRVIIQGVHGVFSDVFLFGEGIRQVPLDSVWLDLVPRDGVYRLVDGNIFSLDPVFGLPADNPARFLVKAGNKSSCFTAYEWDILASSSRVTQNKHITWEKYWSTTPEWVRQCSITETVVDERRYGMFLVSDSVLNGGRVECMMRNMSADSRCNGWIIYGKEKYQSEKTILRQISAAQLQCLVPGVLDVFNAPFGTVLHWEYEGSKAVSIQILQDNKKNYRPLTVADIRNWQDLPDL